MTPRQRQEIFALNRLMTRVENACFVSFCLEKGLAGDGAVDRARMKREDDDDDKEAADVGGGGGGGYDIFM